MTYTLWQLLRDAWAELGQLQVGEATGGSAATLVDSKLIDTGRDDDWKDGTVIILEADGESPEGEFGRVSSYVDSTGTLSFPAMTAAVASGDLYGLVSGIYALHPMIQLVNLALRSLGDILNVDTTTLDTATGKTEYAAAAAWKRRPPRQVDIQGNLDDADDNRWVRVQDWCFVPAAAGNTGLIVLRQQPEGGRDIRVWYESIHPRVSAYNDVIHESIHPALAAAAVVEKALVWQTSRLDGHSEFLLDRLNEARSELNRQKMLHPIWKGRRTSRGLGLGRE
ncbi:MAG: hypothetical protein JW757_10515 [Anaerolineales bacterium]|nr:hypothetical protein [Anaerolineales bacterium]